MKIVQIVPVLPSAITIQARGILKHNKDFDIKLVTLHPKRPDKREIDQLVELWKWADVIDVQYWKSGAKFRELRPDLWNKKKKILTHYNPYNLKEETWEDYAIQVVVNSTQAKELPTARVIPLTIDLDFFKFGKIYTTEPIVNMTVSRIEGKKGVEEVAQACKELEYKLLVVGRVSDGNYMDRVKNAGGKFLTFRNNVSDREVRQGYYESAIHVCNSVPNFESGTMPILEAMACGVPVLTQNVGHVPDLNNGSNMRVMDGGHENVESIKEHLKELMSGRRTRVKIRDEAAKTVQNRDDKIRAAAYRKLYEELA
jgi:glycosyltransferase involved in cell wall biosynthesis